MKIPEYIKSDYAYYKQQNHFVCNRCNSYAAKFTYLKIHNGDMIAWRLNCQNCGEDFEYTLPYLGLIKLYLDYKNAENPVDIKHYQLWQMFRLGLWYREVFKHEIDRNDFGSIVGRLHRDTTGIKKYWSRYVKRRI